ncbi:BrnA antitoxin family protein [Rhizobium giardinii]
MPVTTGSIPMFIDTFKAGGKSWQSRINGALRKAAGL